MSSKASGRPAGRRARHRLSRDERYQQLIEVAWRLVRTEGADALSLGRLAELAGVTKPVVYDHFETRNGLLAALYQEFDSRQCALIDEAIEGSEETLAARASVLAQSYLDCVLAQGREIPGISAALRASPELEKVKRESEMAFLERCRAALLPVTQGGSISFVALRAMLGAAEALSYAAAAKEITAAEATSELRDTIISMISRQPTGAAARKRGKTRART